jgi:exosortase N
MILSLKNETLRFCRQQYPLLLAGVYAVLFVLTMQHYVVWLSANFILGLLALCLAPVVQRPATGSHRFGIAAACIALLYLLIPAKTGLYAAIILGVFYLAEQYYGRINPLLCGIAILMSPLFDYTMNVFSFPIRLQITAWAGKLLSFTGTTSRVEGNMIYHNGQEFSVDAACMGLHMLVTSLLCGIMLILLYQQQYRLYLKKLHLVAILGIIFLLNIFTNLCRIICLVQFSILPDHLLHDIIGIVCLVIYVILPAMLLCRWAVKRLGQPAITTPAMATHPPKARYQLLLLLTIISVAGIQYMRIPVTDTLKADHNIVPGYTTHRLPGEVIKLEHSNALVYIKRIPGFYYPDHHPMICWKGSGFSFVKVQEETIGGLRMYTAVLQQEKEQLFTAWWYDNGQQATISQLEWRWEAFCSQHNFSLVNVTAASRAQLEAEVARVVSQQPFRPLLQ